MPRKKLDEERIPQILDAFENCIKKYGLIETSLEQVAREAGISRTTIHHYIGGREEMIKATYTRFIDAWLERANHLADVPIEKLTDFMLAGWIEAASDRVIIMDELNRSFSHDSEISETASELFAYLFQSAAIHLQRLYPAAKPEKYQEASILLYSLILGVFRISYHFEKLPTNALRSSMIGILENLFCNAAEFDYHTQRNRVKQNNKKISDDFKARELKI